MLLKMVEKEVFSCTDELIVSRLCNILRDKGITFTRKDGGAGDYLYNHNRQDILSQKKIFVSDEEYDNAREIIEFLEIEEKNDEEENEIKALRVIPIEDEFGYGKYYTLKVIIGIFIGTALALFFIFFIIQIMMFVL